MSKRTLCLVFIAAIGLQTRAAHAGSCAEDRGAASSTLVEECREVSPATHPPCAASNACGLIESEIRRGCRFIGSGDAPPFCEDYRD